MEVVKIDEGLLAQGVQQYDSTMTDENRAVRDPVITPFALAMKLGGYTAVTHSGGATLLRECPHCRSKYSTQYQKNGLVFWGCPHCKTISQQ